MAARAFLAAMWCALWPSVTIASGWRCAGPNLPDFCNRSAASARSTLCRQMCAMPPSVEAAARDAQVLINLVGILFERGRQRFDAVHAYGAEQVALAANAHGARMVHVSAIGADANSPAPMPVPRPKAEQLVLAAQPSTRHHAAVDHVRSRRRLLQSLCRARAHVAGTAADRRRPYAISSRCLSATLPLRSPMPSTARRAPGTIYELGGPDVRTFKELMQFVLATIERKRLLVPLPFFVARLQAMFLQYLPKPLLTPDQVELLRSDNIVSEAAKSEGTDTAGTWHRPRTD